MPRETLPKSEVLLAYAEAAVANGRDLARDARILAELESWPRATALMILACEELGKAKYAHLLGVGVLKEKLGGKNTLSSMDVLKSRHSLKQMFALDVELPHLGPLIRTVLSETLVPDDLDIDSPEGERALQGILREARKRISQLPVDHGKLKDDLVLFQQVWNDVVIDARWDKLKQQCFYVDFADDRTSAVTPQRVGSAEFTEAETMFERALWPIELGVGIGLTPELMNRIRALAAEPDISDPDSTS